MAGKISNAQRERVLELHAAGLSRNDIVRTVGISAGSVTRICQAAGRAFDRASTKDATLARTRDMAQARIDLAWRLEKAAVDMLDMIDRPFTVFNFGGKDNTFEQAELPSAPVEARRTIVTSAAIVFDKLSRIVEKDTGGLDDAVGMLDTLAEGFKEAAAKYRAESVDAAE